MKNTYPNLDLLRSYAVLSVFLMHVWHLSVEFGYVAENTFVSYSVWIMARTGVAFFFVHTCLVLLLSMKRSPKLHSTRNFYIRRAFRIYPLCWAAIIVALTTHLTNFQFPTIAWIPKKWLLANFLLVHNLVHDPRIQGMNAYGVISTMWTLPLEVQMYVVLPFFFLILDRRKNPLVSFSIWLVFVMVAVTGMRPGTHHMGWSIFPPMFSGGMIAYQLLVRKDNAQRWLSLPGRLWPVLLVLLFVIPPFLIVYPEMYAIRPAIVNSCDCMLLGASIAFFREISAPWLLWAAEHIAKYSYSIYLFNYPIVYFVYRYMPHLWHPFRILLVVILTAAVSFLTFHLIEDPMIRLGKRLTQTRRIAARGRA